MPQTTESNLALSHDGSSSVGTLLLEVLLQLSPLQVLHNGGVERSQNISSAIPTDIITVEGIIILSD